MLSNIVNSVKYQKKYFGYKLCHKLSKCETKYATNWGERHDTNMLPNIVTNIETNVTPNIYHQMGGHDINILPCCKAGRWNINCEQI